MFCGEGEAGADRPEAWARVRDGGDVDGVEGGEGQDGAGVLVEGPRGEGG